MCSYLLLFKEEHSIYLKPCNEVLSYLNTCIYPYSVKFYISKTISLYSKRDILYLKIGSYVKLSYVEILTYPNLKRINSSGQTICK